MVAACRGRRSPTRASLGTASLSISNLFVFSSGANLESPVTLPPGRARLATKPAPTGSPALVITIGIVVVALLAANAGRSRCDHDQINLETNQLRRKLTLGGHSFSSANRYSMLIFFPSIHPSLLSSCRNASTRTAIPEAVLGSRKPMRKTFPACCASANEQSAKSIALSAKATARSLTNFRFSILRPSSGRVLYCRLSDQESKTRRKENTFMRFVSQSKSAPQTSKISLLTSKRLPNSKRAEPIIPIHTAEEMGASVVANSANKKDPRL